MEALETVPAGAVRDRYCEQQGVPAGMGWLEEVRGYESQVLARR
jgi:L-rhamnose isomerase